MLITAVIILVLFSLFYLTVKKEKREQEKKWQMIGDVGEETVISGRVIRGFNEKKRFYQEKFIWHTEIIVKNDYGETMTIIMKMPQTNEVAPTLPKQNDHIVSYGHWNGQHFLANRMIAAPVDQKNKA